jgi:hypothetical protein
MIRDENGKLAITPGEWIVTAEYSGSRTVCLMRTYEKVCNVGTTLKNSDPATFHATEQNAALIAEAGTVTNECGKTPRELLDLCRGLRLALAAISNCDTAPYPNTSDDGPEIWKRMRFAVATAQTALAKSEGV